MLSYDPALHRFNFAAWTSARASGRGVSGLTNAFASQLLDACDGISLSRSIEALPEPDDFAAWHLSFREKLIRLAKQESVTLSHGVAAKLINVFLKTLYLRQFGEEHSSSTKEKLDAIHPPVDRILLSNLAVKFVQEGANWADLRDCGWKSFGNCEYKEAIKGISHLTNGELWKIEQYWTSH